MIAWDLIDIWIVFSGPIAKMLMKTKSFQNEAGHSATKLLLLYPAPSQTILRSAAWVPVFHAFLSFVFSIESPFYLHILLHTVHPFSFWSPPLLLPPTSIPMISFHCFSIISSWHMPEPPQSSFSHLFYNVLYSTSSFDLCISYFILLGNPHYPLQHPHLCSSH